MSNKIKNIAVYCGSSNKIDEIYKKETEKLGIALAKENMNLVFGAGNIGLMGIVARAMYKENAKVIGVTTKHIQKSEIKNPNLTKYIVTKNLRHRKEKMDKHCDAVVALPGGMGTVDEVAEMIALKQTGHHNKPIVLFNMNGFWDGFVEMYQKIIDSNFAKKEHMKLFNVANTVEDVIKYLYKKQPKQDNHNWRL